jgi:hypothetical protein
MDLFADLLVQHLRFINLCRGQFDLRVVPLTLPFKFRIDYLYGSSTMHQHSLSQTGYY